MKTVMRHHNQRYQVLELSKVEANKDLFGLRVTSICSLVKVCPIVFFVFCSYSFER